MQVNVNELPSSLTHLGMGAFMSGGPNVKVTKIPKGLKILPAYCFQSCDNVKISSFGSNDNSAILEEIGQACFSSAGNGSYGESVERIDIYKTVNLIGNSAFNKYCQSTLQTAGFYKYDAADDGVYGTTYNDMGLEDVVIEGLV